MKILLIQPAKPEKALGGEDFSIFEPLALEYLAAGVPDGNETRILDMRIERDLDSVLRDYRPDVAGITSYTVHVNTVKRLFRQIKTFNPDIVTIVGGHHATVMPGDFCLPDIDIVVVGEGVFPFREIILRLEKKIALSGIPGAVPAGEHAIVIHPVDQAIDLDDLPFPRRDLTAGYRKTYFSEWMKPLASIRTSKGCLFRCRFCALWKLTGGRYLTRKPEHIVEELGTIEEKCVFFADDESLIDVKRMGILADLIEKAGIKKRYFLYGRSDTIAKHPELVERWKKIGLERVFVGLEFSSDDDMKSISKGSTVENNRKAVKILKRLGIDIFPTFILKPEFDRSDFTNLRDYCLELELDFIGFSVLTPLPGTDLYTEVRESLITSDYDFFDFFHSLLPTRLPIKDFYREVVTLFKRSRSVKSQFRLLSKYPLREMPSLFRAYGDLLKRLGTLERDYQACSGRHPD
ncbi:MAG: radical SAM protein [Candidatus Eremiobacteraeota bacterium]|nr:radical SAM protein [Candidatus Eremiobacteraeota bacterium]